MTVYRWSGSSAVVTVEDDEGAVTRITRQRSERGVEEVNTATLKAEHDDAIAGRGTDRDVTVERQRRAKG